MDDKIFDGIARALGRAMTRRAGVAGAAAALAALAGAAASPEVAEAAGRGSRKRSERRARPQGPCGDGSREANVCAKNAQCCTGYCKKGLKNRDGKGRCRCIRRGKPCNPSQTCCKNRQCVNGRCGAAAPAPETCLVCATGCKYTSVSAAYAGEPAGTVIPIAAGRYGTGIAATKSMTLKACNGVSGVILYPDGSVKSEYYSPPRPAIVTEMSDRTAAVTMTLIGMNLELSEESASEALILASNMDVPTPLSIELEDCDLTGGACLLLGPGAHVISGTTIHDCVAAVYLEVDANALGGRGVTLNVTNSSIIDNDSYGLNLDGESNMPGRELTVFTITNSIISRNSAGGVFMAGGIHTMSGCTVQGNGANGVYGGVVVESATATITDTLISGNTSSQYGGGVYVNTSQSSDASLTIAGTTTITGNTAPEGSGIGVNNVGSTAAIVTGASNGNVFGNTVGDQCERNTTNPENWTVVSGCAF